MSPQGATTGRGFIAHLHAFRGFAILNIVAVHTTNTAVLLVRQPRVEPTADTLLSLLNQTLFHDATIYFALVSGLLYATILRSRGWVPFFRGKLFNVIMPYAVMTALLSLWQWPDEPGDPFYGEAFQGGAGDFLGTTLSNLLTGSAMFHMWYMPVIALLFLTTPFIASAMKSRWTSWMVVVLALLPLAVSRIGFQLNWQSVVYFLGAYAAGIWVGSDYDRWLDRLERHLALLVLVAMVTTGLVAWLLYSKIEFVGPVSAPESVFYIQKLAISAVALVLFSRHHGRWPRWLDMVATLSFAIYFLHAPIDFFLAYIPNTLLGGHPSPAMTIGLCVAQFVAVMVASVAIAALVRKIAGRRSRMLIGA